jgi:predicted S18 family serine protease
MKSIRRKLKRNKLILRLTDKSNIFYICRSIDFENKVQAYREKTNAYQELTSNPLEEILYKVTRLLTDLRTKNLIQANQYDEMMPKRAKVRLGYMYFNPKVHKVRIKLFQNVIFF